MPISLLKKDRIEELGWIRNSKQFIREDAAQAKSKQ